MNKSRAYKRSRTTPHGSAWKKKIEAWSCHTAFERTPLAPSKIPHSVKARKARFPSLWRHSSAIPVFFSLHISTLALLSFFDRKTAQNSKNKPENLRWTFFQLHCSGCLELAAGRPESFSSLPSFKVNLKTHFFRQAYWLICTCQLLPVSYSCACASVGGDWERWN